MEEKKGLADYFRPKEYVDSVYRIDLDRLYRRGIRALIIDLDDTLIPRRDYSVPMTIYAWVEKAKEKGFKIYLASNGSRLPRVKYIIKTLQIDGNALSFKPLPFAFYNAMKVLDVSAGDTAVIGDQLITDMLGGNILGMYTILVNPLSEETSLFRMPMRLLDNFLIRLLKLRPRP
ncbi:MAG: YqeG family HAD IIIA-type phosphatase [Candidatus Saganbacteria bacterium]|nr:YqeG family HAD IIIA-type phosphatase [Candidatus Saganbacteria bacterium]